MSDTEPVNETERRARFHFAQGDFAGAETLFGAIARASPHDALAQYNWGVALGKLDQIPQAMDCYRKTIELNPHFADAYINFGICLNELGLVAQARQGFALARQIIPESPVPIVNEGISALALGDYKSGWKDFSARWDLPAYAKFKRHFPKPPWTGENLEGKTLFLYAEQGFGDTLQMARFIDPLTARGAKIILESPPALTRLLKRAGHADVLTKGEALPPFDYHCSMMDLPRALQTTLETIPSSIPYLFADDTDISAFQKKFPRGDKRRIGLSWAGRASHENDANRSLKLIQMAPLYARPDIEWVSVQRVVYDKDAPVLAQSPVQNWGASFDDFADAAAAISTLDLVITVDTAIAHLAGALGKPVWILLPFFADWRWLIDREDSPWYPTARLFRQKKRRDWSEVIARVAASL